MTIASTLRVAVGRGLYALARFAAPGVYAQDGLISTHSHSFLTEAEFQRAYARGVKALGGVDSYRWHWRVHVGLWAATVGVRLAGDFVECGVNKGFLSSAIMEYLRWNTLHRDFFLLDSFAGLDSRFVSDDERRGGALKKNTENLKSGFYTHSVDSVRANFAEWPRAHIIEGTVPETLTRVSSQRVTFLHIDMNCAAPEIAALDYFWDRMPAGTPILLDDYAYHGFSHQKSAVDSFSKRRDVQVCSLPTGQGLILKPSTAAESASAVFTDFC